MDCRLGLPCLFVLATAVGGCFSSSNQPQQDAGFGGFEAGLGDDTGSSTDEGAGEATSQDGGGSPSVSVSAGSVLDFGMLPCGAPAPGPQTFSVTNTGKVAVHYALALSAGSAFQIVGPTSGDVEPGRSATATLTAAGEPTSATAGAVDQATLTVTTSDPALPSVTIPVKRPAQGATLTLSPSTAAVGDVPVGASSSIPVALTNTGNMAASVKLGTPSDPQV